MPRLTAPSRIASGIPGPGWPADAAALEGGGAFLRACRGRTVLACDNDVDGLTAAVIVERVVRAAGGAPAILPARRGEHVHTPAMQRRIAAASPDEVVVLDMGSRPLPLGFEVPTLLVDHHDASAGVPPDALVVNGFDRPPVATTSVLTLAVCRGLPGAEDSGWVAALGAVADLGSASGFEAVVGMKASGATWTRATSLLNAARRSPEPDPEAALAVLREARDVRDITSGRIPGTAALHRHQALVRAEVDRCARTPPVVAGNVALLRFTSAAQVHPIVAIRWAHRLRPRVVIAANDGFIAGRVNFAVRTDAEIDLLQWLRDLPFEPSPGGEYANGHARATGGSRSAEDFAAFRAAAGFRVMA